LYFDLVIYRDEYDIDQLQHELELWYNFKKTNKLDSIKAIHHEFAVNKSLKAIFSNLFKLLSIFLTVPIRVKAVKDIFLVLKIIKIKKLASIDNGQRMTFLTCYFTN